MTFIINYTNSNLKAILLVGLLEIILWLAKIPTHTNLNKHKNTIKMVIKMVAQMSVAATYSQ